MLSVSGTSTYRCRGFFHVNAFRFLLFLAFFLSALFGVPILLLMLF
ncbi:hypothetical protein BMW23_0483 [Bodo saltans virus]|uniref:Transmembrane protein n=1 Tax=Bodo saltans virus TaxID=2024608 RepID=A0A2H4UUC0_9VIRU|nr:hypothetical protein QJ851_gp0470 [Bodo saltans virus]ATZ80533.1 hypothetical protein BMW23_0483 [Bodo saltans virus]